MTRKRYIKLLMSMGYQRNSANALAVLARMGGWTYEQYLQQEKKRIARDRAILNIQIALVDSFGPAVKSALRAMEKLREAVAAVKWEFPNTSALWATEQVAEDPLPPWPKENPHRADALDALRYSTLLHPLPDNVQVMSQADHAALHGYTADIVLVDELETAPGGGQE